MVRSGSPGSRAAALLAGTALVVALLLAGAGPASAHSELERSEPPDGSQIAVDRTTLTLWFTEPVDPASAWFELHSDNGTEAAVRADITNDATGAFIEIQTSPLWQDTFILEWNLLSTIDGHSFPGSVVFGAGVRPATTSTGGVELPPTSSLALRWLDLTALLVLAGGLVVTSRVLDPQAPLLPAELRRAHNVTDLAAVVALLTGILTVLDRVPRYDRAPGVWLDSILFSTMAGTLWGRLWAARELALVVLVVARLANRRLRASGGRQPIEIQLAAAVTIGAEAWAGHAGTVTHDVAPAVIASAAHLAAAAVWVGGLIVLAVAFAPVWDHRKGRWRSSWSPTAVWTRFSPLALGSLVVLVATGLYSTGRHLPGFGHLTSSVWGGALLAKLALALAAMALAAGNASRVHPERARALLNRLGGRVAGVTRLADRPGPPLLPLVKVEIGLLIIAVSAAAGLVSVSTPREVAIADEARSAPKNVTVDDLFTTLEVVPAGAAENRIIVRANSLKRPEPAPIDQVTVTMTSRSGEARDVVAPEVEKGRWAVEVPRLEPGSWDLQVAIRRGDLPPSIAPYDWQIVEPTLDRPLPLERVLTALAGTLLLAALAVLLRGRRQRRAQSPAPAAAPSSVAAPISVPDTVVGETPPVLEVQR